MSSVYYGGWCSPVGIFTVKVDYSGTSLLYPLYHRFEQKDYLTYLAVL